MTKRVLLFLSILSVVLTPSLLQTQTTADSDFDLSGTVDFADFIQFAQNFGKNQGDSGFDPRSDLNKDGAVNFPDFLIFARHFGESVGSTPLVMKITALTTDLTSGNAPLTVQFPAMVESGDLPLSYAWDFGDGSTSTAVSPEHTFTTSGRYTVQLTVTDTDGDSATESVTIEVTQRAIYIY